MRLADLSLRYRLILFSLASALLGLAVSGAVLASKSRDTVREAAMASARNLAAGEAARLEGGLNATYATVHSLGQLMTGMKASSEPPTRAQLDAAIAELLRQQTDVLAYSTLWEPNALDGRDEEFVNAKPGHDATGRYLPYWNRGSGQIAVEPLVDYDKPGANDWYAIPKRTLKDALIEPYLYKVMGKDVLMTSLMSPLIVNGQFVGVVGADYPLAGLQAQLGRIKPFGTGSVTLLSHTGLYATHADPRRLAQAADDIPPEARAAIAAGKPHEYRQAGIAHLFQPLSVGNGGTPWSLRVSFPLDSVMGPANAIVTVSVIVGLLSLILMAVLLTLAISQATRPLLKLAETMEELSQGQGDLTRRLSADGKDEIARISRAFNAFVGRIQELVADIKTQSDHLDNASEALSATTESISQRSRQQSDASSSTAAAIEEVTVSIGHVADHARSADVGAREAAELTGSANARIDAMAREISAVNDTMVHVRDLVQRLDNRTREIDAVATVIKEIAGQTNLLALNAAIEAARAGEQGRGFAVVADEVRKLAERTSQATIEIAQMLESIQQEGTEAVAGVDKAAQRVDQGVALSHEAAEAVAGVHARIVTLRNQATEIAGAMAAQSSASTDIARHVESISAMAQENDQTVHTAQLSVRQLREQAALLHQQVARFRI
ncbi:methyl-accepting chemotaxis protein [Chitinimonas sp. BJYL2]|uniref:methyl-accepting chemotaxis protein n=1 Tax=Chitinimonas sp. BJYL2 TaxID=2976696 RepID=UPI0022B4FFE0|nr:methyl-accepting chemotaxis protein [Chitinimonas sp. BJYL2]